MKRLPVLLAAMLSSLASADPTPAPVARPTPAASAVVDLAVPNAGYDCSPSPIGTGTLPTTRSNAAGTVVWWYCPVAGGGWRVDWAAVTAEQMSARNLIAEARALLADAEPKRAFSEMSRKNIKSPINAPNLLPVWQPFAAEMTAGAPPRRAEASAPSAAIQRP